MDICAPLGGSHSSQADAHSSSLEAARKLNAWVARQSQSATASRQALPTVVQAVWGSFVEASRPAFAKGALKYADSSTGVSCPGCSLKCTPHDVCLLVLVIVGCVRG